MTSAKSLFPNKVTSALQVDDFCQEAIQPGTWAKNQVKTMKCKLFKGKLG
jgi:hypothetical protein